MYLNVIKVNLEHITLLKKWLLGRFLSKVDYFNSLIMNDILDIRRVFKTKKEQSYTYKAVKNPLYDAQEAVRYIRQYGYYDVPEYIDKEIPITISKKSSHIEYKKVCSHCSTVAWVRRRDALYCSGNCRKLAYKERQRKV